MNSFASEIRSKYAARGSFYARQIPVFQKEENRGMAGFQFYQLPGIQTSSRHIFPKII